MAKKKVETKAVKRTKIEKEMTLLSAIERIVEVSEDSHLEPKALAKMAKETHYLAERFGITEQQAILFCVCMEEGPRGVDFNDLARHLALSCIRILSYADDIDALVHRRLLRYRDAKDEDTFDIPAQVLKALRHNEVYETPPRTGLDCYGLFEVIDQLFEDLNDDALTINDFERELETLLNNNPNINFVRQIHEIGLEDDEFLLLMLFCHLCVNKDDNDIRFGQMENVCSNPAMFARLKAHLRDDSHWLIRKGYIEHLCEDGIASPTRYKLTEHTKRTLLAELNIKSTDEDIADLLKASDLTPKKMFYVEENQKQVSELLSFFLPEKYKEIRERMQKNGLRTGFACLFYGGPGTGKTETVYQLARETNRDILVVDIPQIKSKWVGDSEKNIKALFDRYRELVRRAQAKGANIPILLFNEADAIISIRKQGAQNAVDKMENSIQNIILQEMEQLDGIMIATTNLTQNLDSAFERRFLYKIKFEKPDAKVRQRLWQSMMPALSDADALALATGYDFSGGQIENITRKATINAILHGDEANDLACLTSFCNAERLEAPGTSRHIGFS